MLTKTKKIALLTTGLAGTLLATTIGGVILSSCTTGSVTEDPKNEFGNKFTYSIDWNNQVEVSRLNIDRNGLVYSDQDRTILIGVLPGTSVSELVIPRSVKQISGYMNKTGISSGNGTKTGAFENQTTLTSVRFEGSNVQIIGDQAFKGCTSLTTIQLPNSVTTIGNNAFENTGTIAKVNLDNVKFIGNSAFKAAFTNLPQATTEINLSNAQFIDTMAFMNNTAIKSINFNNNTSLRAIQAQAFENSSIPGTINLSKATFLKSIGNSAFKNTTNLDSVIFGSGLTSLGSNAANQGVFTSSSVKSVDLSKTSLTTLNQQTFYNASNLSEVKFGESLTTIDASAFQGTAIASLDLSNTNITTLQNESFRAITSLTEIKFPATLTTLGQNVFRQTNLESVDLSQTKLTQLPINCFYEARNLKEVKLPDGLTTIGNFAFYQTDSLTSIDLMNTQVNSIGQGAFRNSGITSFKLPQLNNKNQITTISSEAFKGSKVKTVDLRFTNLSVFNNSTYEDCLDLEYLLVKSPDLTAVGNANATAVQKQITSVGNAAFKNARKLKGIFHVTDGDTSDQWTPNGIVVASPFLTSIGSESFYNVTEIRVFDASLMTNPAVNRGFIETNLFAKSADQANNSKLEAVILPKSLDNTSGSSNYWIGNSAFKNNPKLARVGTKSTLGFTAKPETYSMFNLQQNTKADDYLNQFTKQGFNISPRITAIEGNAFENTGLESIDISIMNRQTFGGGNDQDIDGFYDTFKNSLKLKKVLLPKNLVSLRSSTFENTPLLEEVNFDELVNLSYIGQNNFTNIHKFQSSSITQAPDNAKSLARSLKVTTPTLDLSQTKLTSIPNGSFTYLPNSLSEVKLPTTLNDIGNNTSLTKIDQASSTPDTDLKEGEITATKIPAHELTFRNVNGEDKTLEKIQSMAVSSSNATQNTYFYTNPQMDLTKFNNLTTLAPGTFNQNPNLDTLKLSAKITTWQISGTSGSGSTLTSSYTNASINTANKLKEISFNGFGGSYDSNTSTFTGDGSNIEGLSSSNWDNNIKNNSTLWSTISTMMNSLGYDAALEANGTTTGSDPNQTPATTVMPGVIDQWIVPVKDSSTGDITTPASRLFIEEDLASDGSGLTGTNKWYTNKANIGQAGQTADKNISDTAPTATETAYFKHNGIIWNWTATVGIDTNKTISISLTPDSSTLPNVYKAQSSSSTSQYYITTFRTAKVDLTSSDSTKEPTPKFGVNIKFNIAVQATPDSKK